MIFHETPLKDAVQIKLEKHHDDRGFFARTFCAEEFATAGLETRFVQHNMSFSAKAGTIRGLHFQRAPHAEVKVICAVRGAIFDVIADLRPDSPTHGQWAGFELSEENGMMLYVPAGFAHGFQTLRPSTAVAYPVSQPYTPEAEDGIQFDDPELAIDWPLPVTEVSDKDKNWPDLKSARGNVGA